MRGVSPSFSGEGDPSLRLNAAPLRMTRFFSVCVLYAFLKLFGDNCQGMLCLLLKAVKMKVSAYRIGFVLFLPDYVPVFPGFTGNGPAILGLCCD